MVGSGGLESRAATAVAVLGIACTGLLAAPVRAADEVGPIVLPGQTLAVLTADIDGDGAAEVLRTTGTGSSSEQVEAWDVVDGSWVRIDAVDVPVLGSEEEAEMGLRPPAALLRTLVDGRERLLVIVAAIEPDDEFHQVCCIEFHELSYDSGGLVLRPMHASGGSAEFVLPADLDGDGTDELVLHHNRFEGEAMGDTVTRIEVLRRGPDGWSTIYESEDTGHGYGLTAGETDGVPGDEILIGPSDLGQVLRMTLIGGEFTSDETSLGFSEEGGGWITGIVDGRLLVTYPDSVEIMRWPRGSSLEPYARLPSRTWPSGTFVGDDREALIVRHDGFDRPGSAPRTTIHDLDLRELGEVASSPLGEELWEVIGLQAESRSYTIDRPIWPVTGPLPGGWVDGDAAYAANGMLIRIGGAERYTVTPMATLIGANIIGLAGPDRAWAVTGTSIFAQAEGGAYLYSGVPFGQSIVALTPVDALLRPDGEVEVASFELRNAVEVPGGDGETSLMAHADGFEIVVTAAAGSVVVTTDGRDWDSYDVDDDQVVVAATPRRGAGDENQDFERWVLVIRPDGIGSAHRWQGTFLREPPDVTAQATTGAFSLRSTISGRVSDGMTVTVDGVPAALNRLGAFKVEVDAPMWPRTVEIVARDPFGTERTERIEIVGFLDYRGLPWVPIVGILTVVVGGVLFVRTPRHRPAVLAADGDGRLEEISAD
jgi:hypothetical protein